MAMNTLDGLPVELKICVLQQMPDIRSIRSLVLASSKYYHTYAAVRSQILFGLLLRQYNNEVEITEALVALRSEGVIAEDPKNKDKIMDLLDCRRRGTREGQKYKHDSFSIDEIVKLLKLHEAAVYFADDFPASIPEPSWWQPSVQGRWGPPNLKFSHTESARFFRAFYRMQTWCHIFGLPEWSPMSAHSSAAAASNRPSYNEWTAMAGFSHEEAWRLIWGTMPPWEVEEVGCLLEYLLLKYIQIFQEITTTVIHGHGQDGSTSDDSASSSPSSSSGYSDHSSSRTSLPLGTPINDIYELRGNPWSLAITFRYSMIEIGPYFLYKILRGSYRYRQNAVANNLRRVFSTKLWEVTSLNNEAKLPLLSPADRYEHDDIAKLVTSWPVLEQPNKAWLERWGQGRPLHRDLWLQHFAGHFSEYPTAHRSDWKWAYVLWDDERLDEWKVLT